MIEHTIHIMYTIVLINFMIHLKNVGLDSIDIGYGQMDVWVNSNIHDHSIGCVVYIINQTLHIVGIFLRLVMEKESMTVGMILRMEIYFKM
jgi:hypothetical protein